MQCPGARAGELAVTWAWGRGHRQMTVRAAKGKSIWGGQWECQQGPLRIRSLTDNERLRLRHGVGVPSGMTQFNTHFTDGKIKLLREAKQHGCGHPARTGHSQGQMRSLGVGDGARPRVECPKTISGCSHDLSPSCHPDSGPGLCQPGPPGGKEQHFWSQRGICAARTEPGAGMLLDVPAAWH